MAERERGGRHFLGRRGRGFLAEAAEVGAHAIWTEAGPDQKGVGRSRSRSAIRSERYTTGREGGRPVWDWERGREGKAEQETTLYTACSLPTHGNDRACSDAMDGGGEKRSCQDRTRP